MKRIIGAFVIVLALSVFTAPVAVAQRSAVVDVIHCEPDLQNVHNSIHESGTVNVIATVDCTDPVVKKIKKPVASINVAVFLVRDGVVVDSGVSTVLNSHRAWVNAAVPCVPGEYVAFMDFTVLFPAGYKPPVDIGSDGSTVLIKCWDDGGDGEPLDPCPDGYNEEGVPINGVGMPYPRVTDLKTGQPIPFPGIISRVPPEQRVDYNPSRDRYAFIKEWNERKLPEPPGGWSGYDLHHIHPREFGGDNSFDNLTPVERTVDHQQFNRFFENCGEELP